MWREAVPLAASGFPLRPPPLAAGVQLVQSASPNAPTRNPQPASRAYSRFPKPVQPANQLRDPRRLPPGLALGPCPASSPPSPKLSAPRLCPPLTRSALGASAPSGEAGRPRRSGLPQGRAAQRASGPTVCRALIYSSRFQL